MTTEETRTIEGQTYPSGRLMNTGQQGRDPTVRTTAGVGPPSLLYFAR